MANFEEKILAYLDGSLPEADREDVLAGISGEHAHSSERALFDAHLRLQDLYSVVRKPVSAPLALQRELATQIPVLAIKLPYLAAPSDRRNRFAAGWLGSIRSSWINVFLLLAALLLAGGVWYFATEHGSPVTHGSQSGVSEKTLSNGMGTPSNNNGTGNAPRNTASTGSNMANSVSGHSNAALQLKGMQRTLTTNGTPTNAFANRSANNSVGSNGTTTTGSAIKNSSGNRSVNNSVGTKGTLATERTIKNGSTNRIANNSAESNGAATPKGAIKNGSANRIANNSVGTKGTATTERTQQDGSTTTSHENPPTAVNTPPQQLPPATVIPLQEKPPEPPPLDLRAIGIREQPISYRLQHDILNQYPIEENASSFMPLRVYASAGERFITPSPSSALSQYVLDNKKVYSGNFFAPSYEAGVEYEFSPWTSAGVRVGQTSFAQYQPFTHGTSANQYSQFYNQFSDDYVNSVPAFWCALSATETFNPQDRMRYSVSLAGGPAFTTPSVAWLGMAEASAAYDLTPALLFRGGVSFDISRVNQGNSSNPQNITQGIITASSGGALTSRAIGITLGLSFHP